MSIIILATAFPAAFEKAMAAVHEAEPGCLLYALHEGPDGRLVMIEKYAGQDAVRAHVSGAWPRGPAGRPGRQARRRARHTGSYPAPGGQPSKGRTVINGTL